MLIHPTPIQDEIVENSKQLSVRAAYKDYEATFVILHPFLKIKHGCEKIFEVKDYPNDWPTKEQIMNCSERITWEEIIKKTGLKDISELDRLLAYFHCARRTVDKTGWIKLMKFIDQGNYLEAQVDDLPEIVINPLFTSIKSLGYKTVLEYSEVGELIATHSIENIIANNRREFYSHARIVTDDKKIFIASDFDQRFSYLSSSKEILDIIIQEADIEGFFCNDTTPPDWSFILETENIIDWSSPERKR